MTLRRVIGSERLQLIFKWSVLLGMPGISFLLFEFITGNLGSIGGIYVWLNLIFFYLFYLTLFALCGSIRVSYLFWNTALPLIAVAEYFVVQFRSRPIMIWDVMAFQTALTVSGSYTYEITPHLMISFILILVLDVLIWKSRIRIRRRRCLTAAFSLTVFGSCLWVFFGSLVNSPQLAISMWNPDESYEKMGYVLCTMRSIGYVNVTPPEGYSELAVREIGAEIADNKTESQLEWKPETDIVPENIICIMNESFSDLSVIGEFETSVPCLPFYQQLEENCIKGNLYVPVFGSMTSNTEYEFLTGNFMAFLPSGSVPYQVYMGKSSYGLPASLKALGYRTVAMHPYPAGNWNRTSAYASLGFDEFLADEYFEDSPLIRDYISDLGNYQKIIEQTEKKEEGQPLFLFNVTMQNHGGYDYDYEATVRLTEYDDMPMTEQYLSLIREADMALEYLLNYYSTVEEPTMIVMFGDHQPSVEPEFYEALYGGGLDSLKPEDYLRRYIIPFMIWTNYDTPSNCVDRLSASYLSGIVMQRANLEMTNYQYFLEEMRQSAPVVHIMGYYNAEGMWESWTGWKEKKEYPLFRRFDILQYNRVFDKKKQTDIFTAPDSIHSWGG